ncbi:hypothetical protein E0L36_25245 [Streptomyces sp. AJS327]|nr:hypothetical protein [Streptomyces sp. AJS327]
MKSHPTPNHPTAAHSAPATAEPKAPKNAARRAPSSALRSEPHPSDGRYPVAWLHITAPGRGATPTARSWCACGRDRFTTGHRRVTALTEDHHAHRGACPLRTPAHTETRTAA